MSDKKALRLSEDPLIQANRALNNIRKTVRNSFFIPLPIVGIGLFGFFKLDPLWYLNPFMAIIFALFSAGQIMALVQMRRVLAGAKNADKSLKVISEAGEEPDLEILRNKLLDQASPGHMRDLLLRWIELGLRGETAGSDSLLDNAWDRRAHHDSQTISMHVSLNRTTLKVGFLGTLYGLILTFPPMKRAVMGLADSEGEMRFIRDISKAIDGDEFAILVTLGATAISILIELVTMQILERALSGFDMVNSHVHDWNLTRLQPWIHKQYSSDSKQKLVLENQANLELKLSQVQMAIDLNLNKAMEAITKTAQQMDTLSQMQVKIGKRMTELVEYEKQYRGFIQTKTQAAGPPYTVQPSFPQQPQFPAHHGESNPTNPTNPSGAKS